MTPLSCPVDGCGLAVIVPEDDPTVAVSTLRDHLAEIHYFRGMQLADAVHRALGGEDTTTGPEVVPAHPIVGVERHRKTARGLPYRHAIAPDSIDAGSGPAMCSKWTTVYVDLDADGQPRRAASRPQPGAVAPDCIPCRKALQMIELGRKPHIN